MIHPRVAAFHSQGTFERVRMQDLLGRLLPPPPARVVDVGGGPGVHAAWLAAAGYDVTLIEPVPVLREQAAARDLDADLLRHRGHLTPIYAVK